MSDEKNKHVNTNTCIFTGNVAADPEITENGDEAKARARFRIAVNNRQGTAWLNLVAFGPLVTKVIKPYVQKGKALSIVARAETYTAPDSRIPESHEGSRNTTSVSFVVEKLELLGSPRGSNGNGEGEGEPQAQPEPAAAGESKGDIPF